MLEVALAQLALRPGQHFRQAVDGIASRRLDEEGHVEAAGLIEPLVGLARAEGIELGDLLAKVDLLLRCRDRLRS